ncbi:hypothetical protein IC582_011345 [Cucumis melo]
MHLTFLSSFSSDVGMYSLSYGGDYITHGSNTRHGFSFSFGCVVNCDLLDMPAVGQLEKDAKYSLVYQLLKIFLTLRLDAYMEFQAANSSLLKSYGLVHEDCIAKMRLLSLVDLGSNESARIPYALIKGVTCVLLVLQINDDEVELWVVKAITSKLIDCKMDQMNEVVIVRFVLFSI